MTSSRMGYELDLLVERGLEKIVWEDGRVVDSLRKGRVLRLGFRGAGDESSREHTCMLNESYYTTLTSCLEQARLHDDHRKFSL